MTNVWLLTHEKMDVNLCFTPMRVYVDLSKYWKSGLSVNAAYEELLMKGMKIDRRTLAAAKDGTLARSEYLTLIRLRDWAREISNNPTLSIDDLLVLKSDESD